MPILLSELIQGHENLTCVTRNTTVQEALDIMLAKQFTQLPIIDDDDHLIGVVSEHSIVQAFYEIRKTYEALAKLAVRNCLDTSANTTLTPQDDIFAAVERLERAPYVIVVDATRVPIGITTSYDTGQVFGAIAEVLVRARDIETMLREYIMRAFPTVESMASALGRALPDKEKKTIDRLTFGDLIAVILNGHNWRSFEAVLGPQDMFRRRMEPARDIRNDIAHYRRQVDKARDIPIMTRSLDWLQACEPLPLPQEAETREVFIHDSGTGTDEVETQDASQPNYQALTAWLKSQHSDGPDENWPIMVRFSDIERLLGVPLPQPALQHRSWWGNDPWDPQADAWLSAGWSVVDVDLAEKSVTFSELAAPDDTEDQSAESDLEE